MKVYENMETLILLKSDLTPALLSNNDFYTIFFIVK